MSFYLQPHELNTGTWLRVREHLVSVLWQTRALLEDEQNFDATVRLRERIRTIKELLSTDPRNDDYLMRDARGNTQFQSLAKALAAEYDKNPTLGPDHG